jgi:hypothetical protein
MSLGNKSTMPEPYPGKASKSSKTFRVPNNGCAATPATKPCPKVMPGTPSTSTAVAPHNTTLNTQGSQHRASCRGRLETADLLEPTLDGGESASTALPLLPATPLGTPGHPDTWFAPRTRLSCNRRTRSGPRCSPLRSIARGMQPPPAKATRHTPSMQLEKRSLYAAMQACKREALQATTQASAWTQQLYPQPPLGSSLVQPTAVLTAAADFVAGSTAVLTVTAGFVAVSTTAAGFVAVVPSGRT